MDYLTDKCAIDFREFALEKYGYSDVYYLGFPVVMEFFDETMDYKFPKIKEIGEIRERKLIEITREFIKYMNNLYNSTFTLPPSDLPPIKELNRSSQNR
ncbi:MAG: hypothetical protein ACRCST_05610 [Turicibacter sp.]